MSQHAFEPEAGAHSSMPTLEEIKPALDALHEDIRKEAATRPRDKKARRPARPRSVPRGPRPDALDVGPRPDAAGRAAVRLHAHPLVLAAVTVLLAVVAFGGYELGTRDHQPRSLASWYDFSGVSIGIGSKEYTEQKVLGEIAIQTLRAADADVTAQTGLGDTDSVRAALESGRIAGYYEYTGTAWLEILGRDTPVPGVEAQLLAVREADAENGMTWLRPATANNTYAIVARPDTAREFGNLETISDYAALVEQNPDAATLCASNEFAVRADGLPGLEEHYGFDLPDGQVTTLNPDQLHQAVGEGGSCEFAAVFNTSGVIATDNLDTLTDDLGFFPLYNVAFVMRTEVYEQGGHAGDYAKLFGEIAARLDTDTLRGLNAEATRGADPAAVAREFLEEHEII